MEHNKELVSLLEKLRQEAKENKSHYENSYINFSDVPGKYIGFAIHSHYEKKLEHIIGKS